MNLRFSDLDSINNYNQTHKITYKRSLLNPHGVAGGKIPSPIPQDSATALLKYNFNVTTNDKGNFMIIFDPFSSQVYVNKDNTLDTMTNTGAALNKFTGIDLPISGDIIDMWRLVSAGMRITYTGQIHLTSGYLIGASTSLLAIKSNDAFLNFTNIEDLPNKCIVMPLDGMNLNYIPVDNEQFNYYPVSDYSPNGIPQTRWKSVMVLAGSGLPANSQCLRIDIAKNIEYVSKVSFREYIIHTQGHSGTVDNSIINDIVSRAVTPANTSNVFSDAIRKATNNFAFDSSSINSAIGDFASKYTKYLPLPY